MSKLEIPNPRTEEVQEKLFCRESGGVPNYELLAVSSWLIAMSIGGQRVD
jgi:hypothetical protein